MSAMVVDRGRGRLDAPKPPPCNVIMNGRSGGGVGQPSDLDNGGYGMTRG